jgi:hypothetical protein
MSVKGLEELILFRKRSANERSQIPWNKLRQQRDMEETALLHN